EPDEAALARLRSKLVDLTGVAPDGPVDDVVVGVHARLARAPSVLVALTLEDALAVEERPNLPGTVDERPNWSIGLPVTLDELGAHPLVVRVTEAMVAGTARRPPSASRGDAGGYPAGVTDERHPADRPPGSDDEAEDESAPADDPTAEQLAQDPDAPGLGATDETDDREDLPEPGEPG